MTGAQHYDAQRLSGILGGGLAWASNQSDGPVGIVSASVVGESS